MSDHELDKQLEAENTTQGDQPDAQPGEPHHYSDPGDEPARLEPPPEQPKLPESDDPKLEEMTEDVRDNRVMGAICYLGVLFIVPLLAKDRSQFAMFHCRQGIMLFAFQSLLSFVVWVPYIGPILLVLLMAVSLIGLYQAWKGREWKLPVLHKYAEMLKL